MTNKKKAEGDNISINISNSPLKAGRDIDIKGKESTTTTIGDVGEGATVVLGDDASVDISKSGPETPDLETMLAEWKATIEAKIEAQPGLVDEDKEDLKETVAKIETEVLKADEANPGRIEKLLNTIAVMGPDIFEVTVTTLANPLLGIGLVLKKVGDKARLEQRNQSA